MKPKIAIIGAGRAGCAIGLALADSGYKIVSVAGRSHESQVRAEGFFPKAIVTSDAAQAAKEAEVVIIATGDGQIEEVCKAVRAGGGFEVGKIAVHLSGATSLKALEAAKMAGADVASLHPNRSFADADRPLKELSGTYFGITASSKRAERFLKDMVVALGGKVISIKDKDKPLYHAAACIASNYLVALVHLVQETYRNAGLDEVDSDEIFWPLLEGTLKNIKAKGRAGALTGPIARGDTETIKGHLLALRERSEEDARLYAALGLKTVQVAKLKGTLTQDKGDELIKLFEKELS